MKFIRTFSRIFIGVVFIFSGFVKGVDPLGTAYRIEDYFIAYGWEWAMPLALFLSIALSTLEFVLGVALTLNLRLKQLSWPLFFLMIFFTLTTLYDALYEPVPDCGCFGDAIKLSNWETFYKNIVLIVLVLVIFRERKRFRNPLSGSVQGVIIALVILGFAGFSVYQYHHLPWLDFRDWKVGRDLVPDNPGEAKIYLKYRNTETGEEREYLSPNYPWDDSVWLSKWEFVDQRIDDSEVKKGHQLAIYDLEGNDVTDFFITNPDYQFLLISYDLATADREALEEAGKLYEKIEDAGYSFIVITGSLEDEISKARKLMHADLEFFNADDIELKTMIRANPGLILLRDGIVIDKWHYNNFPGFEELDESYLGKN
jgi:uncharacterized membrane protein YphA (DoxX/SURF4 family)